MVIRCGAAEYESGITGFMYQELQTGLRLPTRGDAPLTPSGDAAFRSEVGFLLKVLLIVLVVLLLTGGGWSYSRRSR